MTKMTVKEFKSLKTMLKTKSTADVAKKTGWSETSLRRVKKSRSLKGYCDLC